MNRHWINCSPRASVKILTKRSPVPRRSSKQRKLSQTLNISLRPYPNLSNSLPNCGLFRFYSSHRDLMFPGLIYSNTRTGCQIRLSSMSSFHNTLNKANDRISSMIKSKLDDFFDLAEYDWTPAYSG